MGLWDAMQWPWTAGDRSKESGSGTKEKEGFGSRVSKKSQGEIVCMQREVRGRSQHLKHLELSWQVLGEGAG